MYVTPTVSPLTIPVFVSVASNVAPVVLVAFTPATVCDTSAYLLTSGIDIPVITNGRAVIFAAKSVSV